MSSPHFTWLLSINPQSHLFPPSQNNALLWLLWHHPHLYFLLAFWLLLLNLFCGLIFLYIFIHTSLSLGSILLIRHTGFIYFHILSYHQYADYSQISHHILDFSFPDLYYHFIYWTYSFDYSTRTSEWTCQNLNPLCVHSHLNLSLHLFPISANGRWIGS